MKFLTRDGKEAEKVIPSSSAIERSVFTRLLQKDAGASFEYCPYLTFFRKGQPILLFLLSIIQLLFHWNIHMTVSLGIVTTENSLENSLGSLHYF